MQHLTVKQGGSFKPLITWPQSLVGCTVVSEVRTRARVLVEALAFEAIDLSAGTFYLRSASTEAWPIETLYWDFRVTDSGGNILYIETLALGVEEWITEP